MRTDRAIKAILSCEWAAPQADPVTRSPLVESHRRRSRRRDRVNYRRAEEGDLGLLARLNHELIRDEGADNPMSLRQLERRMQKWLRTDYSAVLFQEASQTVGYALFRSMEEGIQLRQFFIAREMRRRGYGRKSIALLLHEVWPKGSRITVEVLNPWKALGFEEYARTLRIRC